MRVAITIQIRRRKCLYIEGCRVHDKTLWQKTITKCREPSKNAASKTITYHFDYLWLLFLDSWEEDFRIKSVVSRNFASLPGSVPMALAILAAGPSNLVVLGAAFLLCEDEEELEEW